jgi:hypothetical protein
MDRQRLEITFEDCTPADAAMLANNLESDLREQDPAADISREKDRPDSQDFGSTLVLVFGTPVAVALAKAVATFLHRHSGASIKISKAGEVIASNLDSRDAARIAEAFAGKRQT